MHFSLDNGKKIYYNHVSSIGELTNYIFEYSSRNK